jgi:branched-chain amino acid transport system permease protein
MMIWKKKGALAIAVLILLAILNQVLPGYYVRVLTEMMILGLFALSLNLILGYGGLISFGHAGFYGLGAYVVALLVHYTNMSFIAALGLGAVLTGLWGVIVGAVCLRTTRLYFAMLTMAISQLLFVIVYQWYSFTKGDEGIHSLPISGYLNSPQNYFYFVLVVVAVSFGLIWTIIHSSFGYTLRAIRDNPERVVFFGVGVWVHRLVAFSIAAFFAGVAGGLYVGYDHMAYPGLLNWSKSAEPMLMILLGGMHNFFGPLVGAAVFVVLEMLMIRITIYWLFILGIIILLLVMFLPRGICGYVEEKIRPKGV